MNWQEILAGVFGIFGAWSAEFVGVAVLAVVILLAALLVRSRPKGNFALLLENFYETMYKFFEEILGEKERLWIKNLVVSLFFVVLLANLLGWLGDIFGRGVPGLEEIFTSFSSDRNGTFAVAILAVIVSLIVQIVQLGPGKFLYEYFPVRGKGFVTIEKGGMPWIFFAPVWVVVKLFDVLVSLFIGLLDIVGIFAKIISMSFRLFGNMLAGTVLLVLLTEASIGLSQSLVGLDFPVVLPLILFVQWLLVAVIQAFVVWLLTAIFVKVAKS